MKVLVVDDNPLNIEICREILDGQFDVLTACDGHEAVAAAREHDPDLVLLDVMLPDVDGYETCRQLRLLPSARRARIVMVSAMAMPAECAEGFRAGADAYITKPFTDTELLAVVKNGGRSLQSPFAPRK